MVLIVIYPWYPESPYFLIKKGRMEQARKSLNKIHGSDDQDLIEAELARITDVVQFSDAIQEAAATKGSLLAQCFQGANLVSISTYSTLISGAILMPP